MTVRTTSKGRCIKLSKLEGEKKKGYIKRCREEQCILDKANGDLKVGLREQGSRVVDLKHWTQEPTGKQILVN